MIGCYLLHASLQRVLFSGNIDPIFSIFSVIASLIFHETTNLKRCDIDLMYGNQKLHPERTAPHCCASAALPQLRNILVNRTEHRVHAETQTAPNTVCTRKHKPHRTLHAETQNSGTNGISTFSPAVNEHSTVNTESAANPANQTSYHDGRDMGRLRARRRRRLRARRR